MLLLLIVFFKVIFGLRSDKEVGTACLRLLEVGVVSLNFGLFRGIFVTGCLVMTLIIGVVSWFDETNN
ncbi:hypothetical protein NC653_008542 [Populus alba x Populus x berolinensis]|uniref:Uncharacterized protein n=1 Tax=Populus alba x Populus x berolinensis TaxID=444605 RepID=A0AAD6W8N1_9ROSI|nr:hypothetical protein NC653_008542 [Populus alba x Populus x berolinensis]